MRAQGRKLLRNKRERERERERICSVIDAKDRYVYFSWGSLYFAVPIPIWVLGVLRAGVWFDAVRSTQYAVGGRRVIFGGLKTQ